MKNRAQLRRFGNSFGFIVTKPMARELGWDYMTELVVEIKDGKIIVSRPKQASKPKPGEPAEVDLFGNSILPPLFTQDA